MVAHDCHPSTQEASAWRLLLRRGSEFEVSLAYIVRHCLKENLSIIIVIVIIIFH
jgi:hypothetical protein